MYSNLIVSSAWYLGTALECGLVCLMFRRRLYRTWPSLLVYFVASLAVDAALSFSGHRPFLHFYLYWSWIAASALLRLWVLGDVLASFVGIGFIGTPIRISVLAAAVVIAVGAWRLSSLDVAAHHSPFIPAAQLVDTAVAYAWAAFLVTVLFAIFLSRIGWTRRGAIVAGGLSVKVAGAFVTSYLISTAANAGRHAALTAGSLVSFAAIFLWALALATKDVQYQVRDLLPNLSRQPEKAGSRCTP